MQIGQQPVGGYFARVFFSAGGAEIKNGDRFPHATGDGVLHFVHLLEQSFVFRVDLVDQLQPDQRVSPLFLFCKFIRPFHQGFAQAVRVLRVAGFLAQSRRILAGRIQLFKGAVKPVLFEKFNGFVQETLARLSFQRRQAVVQLGIGLRILQGFLVHGNGPVHLPGALGFDGFRREVSGIVIFHGLCVLLGYIQVFRIDVHNRLEAFRGAFPVLLFGQFGSLLIHGSCSLGQGASQPVASVFVIRKDGVDLLQLVDSCQPVFFLHVGFRLLIQIFQGSFHVVDLSVDRGGKRFDFRVVRVQLQEFIGLLGQSLQRHEILSGCRIGLFGSCQTAFGNFLSGPGQFIFEFLVVRFLADRLLEINHRFVPAILTGKLLPLLEAFVCPHAGREHQQDHRGCNRHVCFSAFHSILPTQKFPAIGIFKVIRLPQFCSGFCS